MAAQGVPGDHTQIRTAAPAHSQAVRSKCKSEKKRGQLSMHNAHAQAHAHSLTHASKFERFAASRLGWLAYPFATCPIGPPRHSHCLHLRAFPALPRPVLRLRVACPVAPTPLPARPGPSYRAPNIAEWIVSCEHRTNLCFTHILERPHCTTGWKMEIYIIPYSVFMVFRIPNAIEIV